MRSDRPRQKRPLPVADVLSGVLGRQGWEEKARPYRAWLVWDEVVGPQIAAHARPVRMRQDVLEVAVDHPVWMQQLQLLKPQLLARLNRRLGGEVLRDLYWRRGRLPDSLVPAPPPSPPAPRRPLTAEEKARVEALLAPVEEPELRRVLRRLLSRQLQLDRGSGD